MMPFDDFWVEIDVDHIERQEVDDDVLIDWLEERTTSGTIST